MDLRRIGIDCLSFDSLFPFVRFRILLTYGDQGNIVLRGKGNGGLEEMKRKLNEHQIYVGVIRIRAVDEYGSQRAKFVYINYVGVDVVNDRFDPDFIIFSA